MRTTKYKKAEKFINYHKPIIKQMTGNLGNSNSKSFWMERLVREAYLKGYKAGMNRHRHIWGTCR